MTRADRAALARTTGEHVGWRSHTFADGVRSLTLLEPLDVALAGRLWTRVAQLIARGTRRLIVDATAIEPTGDEPALLAAVFAGQVGSCHTVVVAPVGSPLTDRLPASVGVAATVTDAHHQLESGIVRQAHRSSAAPGGRLPAGERHALAIRQSWRWAQRAAREGEYERALGWLQLVERIEGHLPPEWSEARDVWTAAWTAQTAVRPYHRSPSGRWNPVRFKAVSGLLPCGPDRLNPRVFFQENRGVYDGIPT
jgi:hypothetical protein